MRHFRDTQPPALWHLLLILMLVQGLFVALELGREAGHVIDGEDPLHLLALELPLSDERVTANAGSADNALAVSADSCDHCCLCHGHGSHAATLSGNFLPDFPPNKSEPASVYPAFCGSHPESIYRPPIV